MNTKPVASVVIPSYNRADLLGRTLRSLQRQRGLAEGAWFEVVVADDGSEEDLAAAITEVDPSGRTIHVRHERDGFRLAETRNMGAEAASGPIVIFLDCGTLAGPDLVAAHVLAHHERDRRCAVVAPTFGYSVEPMDVETVRDAFLAATVDFDPMQYAHIPGVVDYRSDKLEATGGDFDRIAVPWRYFWGRNISVSAEFFDHLGGFSERFRSYGVEDVEFGYRVLQSGAGYLWAPDAWALEVPGVEDRSLHAEANRANLRQMHAMHGDVQVEFFLVNRPTIRDEQVEWDRLARWMKGLTPVPERVLSRPFDGRPLRLSIGDLDSLDDATVLLDPSVPAAPFPWTVDGAPLTAAASGLGLRTGYADKTFTNVFVGARMAGAWSRWGAFILAEANRVGSSVELASELAAIRLDTDAQPAF